jgi:hypothetical protein
MEIFNLTKMKNELMWKKDDIFPIATSDISTIANLGVQLTSKEKKQIVSGFEDGHYEMVTNFVWSKAMFVLKATLASMGREFLSELLDRPDIDDKANIQQAVSELEAIRLAEELGIVSGTGIVRLKNASNLVSHFLSTDDHEDTEKEMLQEEAVMIIKPAFQGILAYDKVEAAIDFKNFRNSLEATTLSSSHTFINKLLHSPYFFKRTTIRIILAIIKSSSGAQLENSLANANTIVPLIWNDIKAPEKWQIGRVYAELNADGKSKAVSGLRQVLLKVKGFDFVPEDLRSNSFLKVANEILLAHNSFNNFYNEPEPVDMLSKMGSVIPIPAFPRVMTAILSVKLGNGYGVSGQAQGPADQILANVSNERWSYYFIDCLSNDDSILYKLSRGSMAKRWVDIISEKVDLESILLKAKEKNLAALIRGTNEGNLSRIKISAENLISILGYQK